jgi:hypothetical protein
MLLARGKHECCIRVPGVFDVNEFRLEYQTNREKSDDLNVLDVRKVIGSNGNLV